MPVLIISLLLGLSAGQALSANLYRYIDADGTVVLGRTIPPAFVPKGYAILNEQGTVIKIVPPALTEQEKAAMREAEQRKAIQEARDKELLKLYRSPDDVDRAMNAWTSRLDVEISLKRNQLTIKKAELTDVQAEAAELERGGKEVTPEILNRISNIKSEIEQVMQDIKRVELRKDEDMFMFELDKARVAELTNK